MEFNIIKTAVQHQFRWMEKRPLFRASISGDQLWETYLASFPAGSNPIFRKRTEHDCSCCRHFMRSMGNVVSINDDNRLVSLWDGQVHDTAFQAVTNVLSALVRSHPIDNVFLHYEPSVGTDRNFMDDNGSVVTWEHFALALPRRNTNPCVVKKDQIGPIMSTARSTFDVALRGLTEITKDAIDTTLELIDQDSLYRGAEFRAAVKAFQKIQKEFTNVWPEHKGAFVWRSLENGGLRIRNSAIGTLLVDLSEGKELDTAVRSFEAKVAPANYKRPTALVTQKMIDAARKTVAELGLTASLDRRYAHLADVTVNNILFADRGAKKVIRKDAFDDVSVAVSTKKFGKVEEIGIEKFIADVLPKIDTMEVFMENAHAGNLMSLVAPVDPASAVLFKWDNRFSWSYSGDVTDTIKERVKQAGGDVTGDVCCRLSWSNFDDLDFHMEEPAGYEIYYGNRNMPSPSHGRLDVDMNAGSGHTRTPVENIFYRDRHRMRGVYTLRVHQYNQRETQDVGFEVEIDVLGEVHSFSYPKAVKGRVEVARLRVEGGNVTVEPILTGVPKSRNVWGLDTGAFHPVSVLMNSPNFWDGQHVGNKHWFFMLPDCRNDGSARGFYNEFLRDDLATHRKVLELVGSKTRTEEASEQLSGLGFSSTVRSNLTVRVGGSFTRILKVLF